ncbi:MAG: hypothetical protein WC180_01250 [Candidatus Paceibacterota bacterium]
MAEKISGGDKMDSSDDETILFLEDSDEVIFAKLKGISLKKMSGEEPLLRIEKERYTFGFQEIDVDLCGSWERCTYLCYVDTSDIAEYYVGMPNNVEELQKILFEIVKEEMEYLKEGRG